VNYLDRVNLSFAALEMNKDLGFTATDSSANFVFVTHPDIDAADLYRRLKARNILVRWFDKPRIASHLRVTIGREREMDELLKAISDYMDEMKKNAVPNDSER
jgi:histidinol-phosphate aminotransferase